jgi:hypothetical protein
MFPPRFHGALEKDVGVKAAGILLSISFLDCGSNLDCTSMPGHEKPHPHAILQWCSELPCSLGHCRAPLDATTFDGSLSRHCILVRRLVWLLDLSLPDPTTGFSVS